ncbi:MAG: response regulator [Beutenbergiaceae bacterium]
MSIKVLLADDQPMVRGGLAALLSLEADIDIVAEVGRGDEVLAAARQTAPDVCVIDIEMPTMDGVEATATVRAAIPQVRVLIVTTFGRPGYLRRALEAGASGFLVKDTPASELADAVRRVHSGLRVVDPALATEGLFAGTTPLTEREREVLRLVLTGAGLSDIARALHLSPGTVRNYVSGAIGKTNASTRFEAARIAQEHGWL